SLSALSTFSRSLLHLRTSQLPLLIPASRRVMSVLRLWRAVREWRRGGAGGGPSTFCRLRGGRGARGPRGRPSPRPPRESGGVASSALPRTMTWHAPPTGVWTQWSPGASGSHESVVQGLLSSQLGGVPGRHEPSAGLQVSVPLQGLPSSHCTGRPAHAPF